MQRVDLSSNELVGSTYMHVDEFRSINNWGQGVSMPSIPDEVIHDIMYERPFSLLGLEP